jgi:hypothetical protein
MAGGYVKPFLEMNSPAHARNASRRGMVATLKTIISTK